MRYSCAVAKFSCSIFCAGHKIENYCNLILRSHTGVASVNGDEEDEDD